MMILTGPEIRRQVAIGQNKEKFGLSICKPEDWIDIQPYDESLVGPNSVDLRLHSDLKVYPEGARRHAVLEEKMAVMGDEAFFGEVKNLSLPDVHEDIEIIDMKSKDHGCYDLYIPQEGRVLWPGILYLGRTIEVIGSNSFVPIVEGRSSVGRLGVHVHVTAGFCDIGFRGTITLEIHVVHPIRIYPNIPICQAYFLKPHGAIELYHGRYSGQVDPTPSRFALSKQEYQSRDKDDR